jgi:hypothetical protein
MVPVDRFGKLMLQDASGVNIDASQFYVKTTFDDGTIKYYHKDWKGPQDKDTPQWVDPPTTENLELYGIPVIDTSIVLKSPRQNYYLGYLIGDTIPPNGYPVKGMGAQFPDVAVEGNFFIRTDFMPTRLFRFDGSKWTVFEDNIRMTMTNTSDRRTLKTSFINNKNKTRIGNKEIDERQPISRPLEVGKNLKPISDN